MRPRHSQLASQVEAEGFALIRGVLNQEAIATLIDQINQVQQQPGVRWPLACLRQSRRGQTYAIRNLFSVIPQLKTLAISAPLLAIAKAILGDQARPVKATLFDKHATANWKVPWHQDQTITVQNYADVPGFGPWSMKAGMHTVQPPVQILEGMLALRLHLDDCSATNGALKVLPGSHRYGRLSAQQIAQYQQQQAWVCEAKARDVLIMRPLLLHQSSAASEPGHRRVIHLEYASEPLPGNLVWPE